MVPRVNILVGFNIAAAFDRRAFAGIATLANELGNVRLLAQRAQVPWAEAVRSVKLDGLIVSRLHEANRPELSRLGLPFVNVADVGELEENEYVVALDEEAIGSAAAAHFLAAEYQHYAVCTNPGLHASFAVRIDSFVRAVEEGGRRCAIGPTAHDVPESIDSPEEQARWAADAAGWMSALPRPLAVFAPYDYHARAVVDVAQLAGLRVPEDVAVIGVDDDDLYCMTTDPQLSSVVTPGRQVGQIALRTLLRVIRGEADVPRRTLVPPAGVMARGSSSDFALHDDDVIAAVQYIREHAGRGVTVDQVAGKVLLSRRTLERRFMATLAHTVQDEIRRAKVSRAKRLLIDTELPFSDVARKSGFVQQQQLNRVIKLATGQTPAQVRRAARDVRPA